MTAVYRRAGRVAYSNELEPRSADGEAMVDQTYQDVLQKPETLLTGWNVSCKMMRETR